MKSNKSSLNSKKTVSSVKKTQQESKKPEPQIKKIQQETKKTDQQTKKTDPQIQKNSPQPNIIDQKKIITEEDEKKMLQGEIHIEQKENNSDSNIIEQPKEEEKKETPKKMVVIKPRETYLKEKISKLNYNEKILNSVQKNLGEQMQNIKTEIKNDSVLITQVQKDLTKYIPKKTEPDSSRTPNEDYELKKKHKTIKELRDEQKLLKQKLYTIIENENFLENEGYMNSSQKNITLDKSLKEQQLKNLNEQKNDINQRISIIEDQISRLFQNELTLSRKEKIKNYLENFERDKEIAEIRAKKYIKESRERNKRIANDIDQLVQKRKKEIDDRKKEAENQKEEIIKKFKEQEKAIEQKRSKENEKIALQCKPYIYEKPEKKANSYLFSIEYKKFQKKEEKIIKTENSKRKEMMKSVPYEEIKEFAENFDEKKEKYNLQAEEKKKKLLEEWKTRKNNLPSYVNPALEINEEENRSKLENEELKKEKIEALIKNKKNYSTQIQEERQPVINEKLKKQRMDKIKALEDPRSVQVKCNLINYKKKRILLKKRDPTKPSKYKWKLKLDEEPNDKLNNSVELNNSLIKKPKNIRLSSSFSNIDRKKKAIPEKKIDYLKEMKIEREEKKKLSNISYDKDNKSAKWEKVINDKSGNMVQNINLVKMKAENLEKETEMNEKFLRLNGGLENNPELGKKVSNLLIDSIEAKLSILKYIESKSQ